MWEQLAYVGTVTHDMSGKLHMRCWQSYTSYFVNVRHGISGNLHLLCLESYTRYVDLVTQIMSGKLCHVKKVDHRPIIK